MAAFNKFILIILLFGLTCSLFASQNILLQPPQEPKYEEILASFQSRSGTYGLDRRYFLYRHGSVVLYVIYDALPAAFTAEERALFSRVKQGDKTVYVMCFGDLPPRELPEAEKAVEKQSTGTPQCITVEALAQDIASKRVLFFTGAGISAAAGIHTISSLHSDLGLDPNLEVDDFVYNAMHNPELLVQKILAFYRATKLSQPTPAHRAVAGLAKYKNCQILTGNFDLLHERSGVIPIRVFSDSMEQDLTADRLREVDMIVYIGASRDIRGTIDRYKKAKPEGVVVAINQEIPRFLTDQDFVLLGDIQEILPLLQQQLMSKVN